MRVSAVLTPLTPRLEDEEQAGAIQIVLDTKQGWVFIREVFEVNGGSILFHEWLVTNQGSHLLPAILFL